MYTTAAMGGQKKGFQREFLVNDEWITPEDVWQEFATLITEKEILWEPFVCKDQQFSKQCWDKLGIPCIQTFTDFFETNMPKEATVLISNPPFSKKFEVVEKCLQDKDLRFALLLPAWVFASSTVRKIIYKTKPKDLALIVPKKRVHYLHPKTLHQHRKTNFDSVFISRGILPAGVHYL